MKNIFLKKGPGDRNRGECLERYPWPFHQNEH